MTRALLLAAQLWIASYDMPRDLDEVGAAPVLVVYEAQRQGVDPVLAWALAWRESRFRWWRVSRGGCVGPLQIKPYHCRGDCRAFDQIRSGIAAIPRYVPTGAHDEIRAWNCGRAGARRDASCGDSFAQSVRSKWILLRGKIDIR